MIITNVEKVRILEGRGEYITMAFAWRHLVKSRKPQPGYILT
jgi:hypothetical protein